MSILVTGGAGYIGSHMVWELLGAGEEVIVLDRLSTGFEWAVAPDAHLIVGDIADSQLVENIIKAFKVDSVIHFAGSVVVPESVVNPLAYYDNNTAKTRALVETVLRGGVKHFIFSSTAAVYGTAGAKPISEECRPRPESPYGRSKLMSEWMLADAAAAHGLRFSALRYFNVAGADPHGRSGQSTKGATHLIKVAVEAALGKRPFIEVFGDDYPTCDGTCVRDYIHVSDLATVHRLALERLRQGADSLIANCGYGRGYSVLEVLDSVKRVHGRDIDVRIAGRRPGDPAAIVADPALLQSELAWEPRYDNLDRIVASALAWERHLSTANQCEVSRRIEAP